MAEIGFTLALISIGCLTIAIIIYIIGGLVSTKSYNASLKIFYVGIPVVVLGVISGLAAVVFDCVAELQIEYVECEYCGSRVPKDEYIEE